ncbi:NlpC/P60 family protein [Notoacmeibacter sp. MSK16QG-6]|uniref:C40 family peptidase n=1 Tax=Notoacmeibacter sp. MSK16QG-6 TaxID=2957982 RepID=UPI0020A05C2A|nr:NlpC/P60 family protein [Notoacmeibacter sp. MSK16QG-6]MCP1198759.1 C40 family peptidase [Notoacmeibacter sp. MSK16QG-6]
MSLDPRLHAFRDDLADVRLEGQVRAERFVKGEGARCIEPVADLRAGRGHDTAIGSQLLLGEEVLVFERRDGWAWVQSARDRYVGYVEERALGPVDPQPTHTVSAALTFAYAEPELRTKPARTLSLGSEVTVTDEVEQRGNRYLILSTGEAVFHRHLTPLGAPLSDDYVDIAESLIGTPYLWGGGSALGIDCSGLVQLSLRLAGTEAQRDSDMQAAGLGVELQEERLLRRGDLVFWKGHVGIMADEATLLHASGYAMAVVKEPLADAIARIGTVYGGVTVRRRV